MVANATVIYQRGPAYYHSEYASTAGAVTAAGEYGLAET